MFCSQPTRQTCTFSRTPTSCLNIQQVTSVWKADKNVDADPVDPERMDFIEWLRVTWAHKMSRVYQRYY